ncbi:uncharacterized protein B0J16DRAFT_104482 [Fusarium flagelliforme]|uniref:Helicase polq-like protein n=1 Tax=Fusarium flagelliforme TaxID=2675880 RepID=A0A395MHD7_9HYPO|nr:uncharacterized protein B0J16DRAFT_104482 [Fusarium flagelliforme]KAH7188932.1 hypothetical protein B0J16DRAFT_104482 [Fusarium flagelliforme]RFN46673.1 helicase polq-like protein [Fusarium flagelliforme]
MAEDAEPAGSTVTAHVPADAMGVPPPIVIQTHYQEETEEKIPSTTEDLWVSSADGRYSCPPVPLRVGPINNIQTFYVHRDILLQAEWFQKALCGNFREASEQVIDLPEEDPAIFHFLVAFLYEGSFEPIRPAASVLEPEIDKGKAIEVDPEPAETSDSSSSDTSISGTSNSSWRRRRARQTRPAETEESQEKQPGHHRPGCPCPRCLARRDFKRCWQCGANRSRDVNTHVPLIYGRGGPRRGVRPPGAIFPPTAGIPMPSLPELPERITGEDLRTWFLAYELNLDVYICANRFLMDDFKGTVMRSCVDMLETAGWDAAQPEMMHLCRKLYRSVPEVDELLKMVLARIGFLQPLLWKRYPEETSEFLVSNPELAATILRETVMRHSQPTADLPPMEAAHTSAYDDEWQHLGRRPPVRIRPNRYD